MFKSNNQGHCPYCDSDNLDYGRTEFEGEMCYFPFTCQDCGKEGEEWYSMEFTGHNAYNEDNEIVEVEYYLKEEN